MKFEDIFSMKITLTSDLHGYFPKTLGGDLLIVAGDLTSDHSQQAFDEFDQWLYNQEYRYKIVIAGNHDSMLVNPNDLFGDGIIFSDAEYLCDSGTTFEGLKIWGSPWSLWFYGINPYCKAFTGSESELKKRYDLIPDDIDILITHGPPYGLLDKTIEGAHVGSYSLRQTLDRIRPRIHIFGHIHECGGKRLDCIVTEYINASHVNRAYEPVNPPIDLEL